MKSLKKVLEVKVTHVNNSEYSIQLLRWFLKPIGAWPCSKESSQFDKILSRTLAVLCIFFIVFPVIPCAMYSVLVKEEIPVKLKAIGPMSFWIMAFLKIFWIRFHAKNIINCLQHIETDWETIKKPEEQCIMLSNARIGRYIAMFCAIFVHTAIYSYNFARRFTTVTEMIGNESIKIRMLPLPFYNGIIDTRFSPAYEFIFALQNISGVAVNFVTAAACSLAAIFVMHACGQLNIITSRLASLVYSREKFHEMQADIIGRHLRVLSFISIIEEIMNQICFVEIFGCTLNMCLLGYYFLMEIENHETANILSYSIVYISVTFNIFIFCYIGEILLEQCKQIGETAYMTEWYLLPKKNALGFILIISRSRLVIKITAGKLIQLSLSTFGNVIRTSLAYLNMLRQVT